MELVAEVLNDTALSSWPQTIRNPLADLLEIPNEVDDEEEGGGALPAVSKAMGQEQARERAPIGEPAMSSEPEDASQRISTVGKWAGDTKIAQEPPETTNHKRKHDYHPSSSNKKPKIQVFCLYAFERLRPMTNLQGEEFWTAFCELIRCHYFLWEKGLHHGDISISNLMHKDGKGILNDWDLARLVLAGEELEGKGHDRTGTMAFMALDLLTPEGWKGQVRRLYRHELESFMWVLVWITMCFTNGNQKIPKLLRWWIEGDNEHCASFKHHFLPTDIKVTTSYEDLKWPVIKMHYFWQGLNYERRKRATEAIMKGLPFTEEEPLDLDILKQMIEAVCKNDNTLMIKNQFAWV